jgi:hypothetical protein
MVSLLIWRNADPGDVALFAIGAGGVFVAIAGTWIWVASWNHPLWFTIPYAVALLCGGAALMLVGRSWFLRAKTELSSASKSRREF